MIYKMNGYGVDGKKDDPHYSIKTALAPHGYNDSSYGFLAGMAYSIPFAVVLLVSGPMADSVNRTWMCCFACLGWSGCVFAMSYVETMEQLIALRMAQGFF